MIYLFRPLLVILWLCVSVSAQALQNQWQLSGRARVASLQEAQQDGQAASLLLRGTWQAQWQSYLHSELQLDGVAQYWQDQHSDGFRSNGRPLLPDVAGTDINQAFVDILGTDWQIRIGRQSLNYDDERFVGSVSFWQNEQTFDALQLTVPVLSQSKLQYAFVNQALRISGRDADRLLNRNDTRFPDNNGLRPPAVLGEHELNTHLWRVIFDDWDFATLKLFSYYYKNKTDTTLSNHTTGFHQTIKFRHGDLRYRTLVSAAHQQRLQLSRHPATFFVMMEGAAAYNSTELALHFEQLSATQTATGNISFITPLASLHEHQGWADLFNTPPHEGLRDYSLRLSWRDSPWRVSFRYHRFNTQKHNTFLGEELDLDLSFKIQKQQKLHLRTALFFPANGTENRYPRRQRLILSYSWQFESN